ncbi:hypothetical protein JTB14_023625 [Gonioctena quinquepunctata]|nr:hypothetical protein JTB14_023625 [Gonioctena quinquepunctata]
MQLPRRPYKSNHQAQKEKKGTKALGRLHRRQRVRIGTESNLACTQVKGRPCPRRAPRKKLLYAAEASNNYRISLEKKNDIKSKYYEKKIILLERIATAKERSAAAQEDIANKLGCLEGAIESLQDAIA